MPNLLGGVQRPTAAVFSPHYKRKGTLPKESTFFIVCSYSAGVSAFSIADPATVVSAELRMVYMT